MTEDNKVVDEAKTHIRRKSKELSLSKESGAVFRGCDWVQKPNRHNYYRPVLCRKARHREIFTLRSSLIHHRYCGENMIQKLK